MVWRTELNVLVEFDSPRVYFSFLRISTASTCKFYFLPDKLISWHLRCPDATGHSLIILAIISYVYLKFIGTKLPIILIIQIPEPALLYLDVPRASTSSLQAVLRLLRNPDWEPREQSLIFCLFLDSKSWDVGFTVKGGFLLSFE